MRDNDVDDKLGRLRSHIVGNWGPWCAHCGTGSGLGPALINQCGPISASNAMMLCRACSDHHERRRQ